MDPFELYYWCRNDDKGIIKKIAAGVIFFTVSCVFGLAVWLLFPAYPAAGFCMGVITFAAMLALGNAGHLNTLVKTITLLVICGVYALIAFLLFSAYPILSIVVGILLLLIMVVIFKTKNL